ncbi:TonB-dependent receptor [Methylocystis sp. JAN1]|uniref:TonB-dependent receptor n=1 Tax=Methylocystis sp. JAN1 TaxID=3397211 RepID=UPI003FA1AF60
MSRYALLRGVSAGALIFAALPALAMHTLPTIDVSGQRRSASHDHAAAPSRGPAQPAAARGVPATGPVTAPSPIVSRWSPTLPDGRPAFVERWQLPNTVASVTRQQIERQVNIVDTEDAVKYMPSLFVRKRNNGDTQAVLQTRTWGVNSSARSLVYADDLLLTALIGNDNTIGAPRWGLVAPEEIERVDFLYGPYSAQYPGNSMGGVLKITTRMPEKLEVSLKDTLAVQDFSLYGTSKGLVNNVTSAFIGDKVGDFSWTISGNWQRGSQQPLTYVTAPSNVFYGYPGAYFATTKFGVPATVLGSAGNLANDQVNAKLKLAYDFSQTIRATYTLGFWSNDGTSLPENYLFSGYGPVYGLLFNSRTNPWGLQNSTLQSFGAAYYRIQEKILTNAAAVKSNTGGVFDWEISASNFTYLQSDQVSPFSAAAPYSLALPLGGYTQTGKNNVYTGTYWTLFDMKGIVRPDGILAGHDISFGLHGDQFHLNNPTWLTTNWPSGTASAYGVVSSIGNGTTRTQALWAQDAFRIQDNLKLTLGVRGEHWQASDGYNQLLGGINANGFGSTASLASMLPIYQPNLYSTRFSPKGSLQWTPDDKWTVTGSVGMANRFPTAKELYNITSLTGSAAAVNPNPNLRPEVALTKELTFERRIGGNGTARVSLFDEEVRDAIISQSLYVTQGALTQLTSGNVNVSRIRNSGVELAASKDDVFIKGLELMGSMTYVNSRIISDPTWAPAGGNNLDNWALSVAGKNVPYVPKWRWTGVATYRPDDHWSFTVAARWQDRMWSTLSNNDIAHGVYGAFDRFFIVDTKMNYKWNERWSFDLGIDNIGNYKYFLFHPFPQRTFFFAAKYDYGASKHPERGIFYVDNEGGLPQSLFQPVAFSVD